MVDITHKSNTLREAIAKANVKVSKPETILAVKQNTVPKGNVIEVARTAGLFGVKKTAELIPDCHPLPVEYTKIDFEVKEMEVEISIHVKTIYKTGVEVEAMHGASIVALTMYDMLKPIDKGVSIQNIRLEKKKGGKSDFGKTNLELNAAVIVCSDSVSAGKKQDKAGLIIKEKLESQNIKINHYQVIPDKIDVIQETLKANLSNDLVIFTGGTGMSPNDVTPEAILPLIEKPVKGIEEAIRKYGQERTPYAMLSRSVAGFIGNTLVLSLPGSSNGAKESIDAVFPAIKHVFKVLNAEFKH